MIVVDAPRKDVNSHAHLQARARSDATAAALPGIVATLVAAGGYRRIAGRLAMPNGGEIRLVSVI